MGIKGTIRRNIDTHFINSNMDTDLIITDSNEDSTNKIPVELLHIMERLCLGRKRILFQFENQEVLTDDQNPQNVPSWLTIKEDPTIDQHPKHQSLHESQLKMMETLETYEKYFKDHRYLGTTDEIEMLRPKSPSAMI